MQAKSILDDVFCNIQAQQYPSNLGGKMSSEDDYECLTAVNIHLLDVPP